MSTKGVIAPVLAALLSLWAGAALAQVGRTDDYGGAGGGVPFELQCPDGYVLVGIDENSDKDLDGIAAQCLQSKGGRLLGSKIQAPRLDPPPSARHGGVAGKAEKSGIAFWGEVICPDGMAAAGIRIQRSGANLVHAFRLLCRNMQTYETANSALSGFSRGAAVGSATRDCGGGAIAVGVFGTVVLDDGDEGPIRRMGLICRVIAHPAPPAPPPKPKPADPPPFAIDNDVHAPFAITNG